MPRSSTKVRHKTQPRRSYLPLWLSLIGVGLVLLAVFVLTNNDRQGKTNVQVSGTPRLQVDQEIIDHGEVKLGTNQRSVVKVSNAGDQPLRFTEAPYIEVQAGCWPPLPAIGSMVLQPGESTLISMEYNMHGDMGGLHDFRLHLITNDPNQPEKEVQILSNWVP